MTQRGSLLSSGDPSVDRGAVRTALLTVVVLGALSRLGAAEMKPVRLPDVVVVDAKDVAAFLGERVGRLRAFVFEGDGRRPVPIQTTPAHELRPFPAGRNAPPSEPDSDGPRLDEDDRLLLWFPDGGERMSSDERADWVEVSAKRRDETRWFYLGLGRREPSKGPEPLVRHDPATGRIRSDGYAAGFSDDETAVMDHLRIGPAGPNLLDRSKARVHVDLALGIGSVTRTEEDVSARVTRIHAGPLLVVREQEVRGRRNVPETLDRLLAPIDVSVWP